MPELIKTSNWTAEMVEKWLLDNDYHFTGRGLYRQHYGAQTIYLQPDLQAIAERLNQQIVEDAECYNRNPEDYISEVIRDSLTSIWSMG